jgi:HrpA-like RNA helicase
VSRSDTARTKSRRSDLFVTTQTCLDFYDARVPADVYDGATFDRWRRQAEQGNPRLLLMTRADLLGEQIPDEEAAAFAASEHPEWQRDGIRAWDFEELPEQVRWQRRGLLVTGYPESLPPSSGGADSRAFHAIGRQPRILWTDLPGTRC